MNGCVIKPEARFACVLAVVLSACQSFAAQVLWGFLQYQGEWDVET